MVNYIRKDNEKLKNIIKKIKFQSFVVECQGKLSGRLILFS